MKEINHNMIVLLSGFTCHSHQTFKTETTLKSHQKFDSIENAFFDQI